VSGSAARNRRVPKGKSKMPRRWVGVLFGLVVIIALAAPVNAQDADQLRTVVGQVVNGTANSFPPFGLTVTLHRQKADEYEELTAVTDTKGNYLFENVRLDPEALYGVTVRHDGVVYGTDIDLRSESLPPVTVTIYETSDDLSMLGVSSASLFISQVDKIERDIYALEIVNVVNDSDRTYVPGAEPMNLLRFGLPDSAKGLQIDTGLIGADAIQVDRGFAITANVPPGEHEVMFAYNFDYEGDTAAFEKSYLYGADNVRVLVPYEIGELSSVDLGDPSDVLIGDKNYQLIEAVNIPQQTRTLLEISSLPQTTFRDRVTATAADIPYEVAVPAGLGLLMLSLIGFVLIRREGFGEAAVPDDIDEQQGDPRSSIIEQMAELEEAFEMGKIREAEYHAKRQALLARLSTQVLPTTSD